MGLLQQEVDKLRTDMATLRTEADEKPASVYIAGPREGAAASSSSSTSIEAAILRANLEQGADAAAGMRLDSKQEQLLHELERQPEKAIVYANLADQLDDDEVIFVPVFGRKVGQVDLFTRAVELEPNCACFYSDLGSVMHYEDHATVEIAGERYDEVQVYVKALELDPTMAVTYLNLKDALEHQGLDHVFLDDNRRLTLDELRETAVQLGAAPSPKGSSQATPLPQSGRSTPSVLAVEGALTQRRVLPATAAEIFPEEQQPGAVVVGEDGSRRYVPGNGETELSQVLNRRHFAIEGTIPPAPRYRRHAPVLKK